MKVMLSKLISDTRPMSFEGELNQFLSSHKVAKVTYSTSVVDGQCLFTALILYYEGA
jgi:hypothetical protein